MTLFERFKDTNEEGFREEFIKPLLVRMGFVGISSKHGSQEFGKDYVFSELTVFGHMRHMVVQAKHEETLSQGRKLDELVSQLEQCFFVSYTLPVAPAEVRTVSAVYLFNSGEITPNAETQLRHRLKKEFLANVHCFSGPQLEILSNTLAYRQDSQTRARVIAMINQLRVNITVWESLLESLAVPGTANRWDISTPIFHGLEAYISAPFLNDEALHMEVFHLWRAAKVIESIAAKFYNNALALPPDHEEHELTRLRMQCQSAIINATRLEEVFQTAIAQLPVAIV